MASPLPHKTSKLPTSLASKTRMRRPPKKPHFFTFVCSEPSSRNGSVIPKSFISKYLKGERFKSSFLKRGSRSWAVELGDVKINGETARIFANGWEKFEKENGLKTGDFILFRLEGNLVFEILVFDTTLCEREFPLSTSDNPIETVLEGKKSPHIGTTLKEPTTNIHGSKEMHKVKEEEAASTKIEDHPSFSSTLTPYNIKRSILYIPLDFARSNGLSNKCCKVILKDEKQRSWPVKLWHESTHVCLGDGWRNFHITNGLKEGDEFMIELLKHGDEPIMNFRLLYQKNKPVKTRGGAKQPTRDSFDPRKEAQKRKCSQREPHGIDLEAQAKKVHDLHGSSIDHFVGILKPYSIKGYSHLYFPREFSRSNGLTNGQMILENENRKRWSVELRPRRDTGKVYIARGWKEFQIANNLKEGDGFKLELIENTGKIPLAKFSCL